MKFFLRLIFVLSLCGVLFKPAKAQNQPKIDSLLKVLKTAKEDTGKVNHLNNLGLELMYSNPDTAIILGNQALSIAKKAEWKKGIANSLGYLGYYFFLKGNYTKALDYYFKVLRMDEELGNKKGISADFGNMGQVYFNQGDYLKALDCSFKAMKIAEELGDKDGISVELGNIGNIYETQGDYLKALDYYLKALRIAEQLGEKIGIATHLGNIGIVYISQGDYPKALAYSSKALKMAEELGDKRLQVNNLGNIGIAYSKQKDYPKALDFFLRALKLENELGAQYDLAITLGNMGSLYTLTGKFKEAETSLNKAIAIAESIGATNDLRQFEQSLSQLYDTTGQYKLALQYYKKAMEIKDTLFNQEKHKEITRKEMNYAFDKKEAATKAGHEKQLAVADVEIKKQKLIKNFFIGGLALLLILSFFVYNNFRIANKLKLQNIRNKIASDLHDDVGSTLNSISVYSEVAKQKSPAVIDELEQIGDASRKIIEVMSDIVWTINPKNDTFENIISRMSTLAYNLLKAKNMDHTFQADEMLSETKLSLESRRNFYLIFKEALNNLVKYSGATRANIALTNDNGLIKLSVRDNGIGFDVAQTSKGNGLLNMKNRAEEMNARLKIESVKGSGTNVELIFKA